MTPAIGVIFGVGTVILLLIWLELMCIRDMLQTISSNISGCARALDGINKNGGDRL